MPVCVVCHLSSILLVFMLLFSCVMQIINSLLVYDRQSLLELCWSAVDWVQLGNSPLLSEIPTFLYWPHALLMLNLFFSTWIKSLFPGGSDIKSTSCCYLLFIARICIVWLRDLIHSTCAAKSESSESAATGMRPIWVAQLDPSSFCLGVPASHRH